MNIFVLDLDPRTAARMLCDKHIPKMLLESCQLLCTAHAPNEAPYKPTHKNHPCTVWVRSSLGNYGWLCDHAVELSVEFERRYAKRHKSGGVAYWCRLNKPDLLNWGLTPFMQAMPDEFRCSDPVAAYRAYYIAEKSRFAKWERGTPAPYWWT